MIVNALKKRIFCRKFINLIENFLRSGVIDKNGSFKRNSQGIPQGSILSPMLSNIVLDKFDKYYFNNFESKINIKDTYRKKDPAYRKLIRKKIPDYKSALKMSSVMLGEFRRIKYVRYADDFRILYDGKFVEVKRILYKLKRYLNNIGLELNPTKTKINRITNRNNKFLGCIFFRRMKPGNYDSVIRVLKINGKTIKRRFKPRLTFKAPIHELLCKLVKKGLIKRNKEGKFFPKSKPDLIPKDHDDILRFYNYKIRGILNYYSFVHNKYNLHGVIQLLYYSCALVLSRKYKIRGKSIRAAITKFGRYLSVSKGKNSLKFYLPSKEELRYSGEFKTKQHVQDLDLIINSSWSNALTKSGFNKTCLICGDNKIEMHHLRSVKNVRNINNKNFDKYIGSYKRKQIPLCKEHHNSLHKGTLTPGDIYIISNYNG